MSDPEEHDENTPASESDSAASTKTKSINKRKHLSTSLPLSEVQMKLANQRAFHFGGMPSDSADETADDMMMRDEISLTPEALQELIVKSRNAASNCIDRFQKTKAHVDASKSDIERAKDHLKMEIGDMEKAMKLMKKENRSLRRIDEDINHQNEVKEVLDGRTAGLLSAAKSSAIKPTEESLKHDLQDLTLVGRLWQDRTATLVQKLYDDRNDHGRSTIATIIDDLFKANARSQTNIGASGTSNDGYIDIIKYEYLDAEFVIVNMRSRIEKHPTNGSLWRLCAL